MPRGLAPKITLGLFVFVLVLGAATSALVYWGFDRGQEEASARSSEGLELQGRATLQRFVEFQSVMGSMQLNTASEAGQIAARAMYEAKATGAVIAWDAAVMEALPSGPLGDMRPERVTDAIIVDPTDPKAQQDLADSAALDAILPAIMAEYPHRFPEANLRPISIFFLTGELTTRYYPPIGALYNIEPGTIDPSGLLRRLGPDENPERATIWTSPYEDEAGRGLVMSAYVAAYDGAEFRGVVGVDISVGRLAEQVDSVRPTRSSFAFYVDSLGNLLPFADETRGSDPEAIVQPDLTGRPETAAGAVERHLENADNAALAAVFAEMAAGNSGVGRVQLDGRDHFIAYAPVLDVGGSLAIAAPVDEITEQAALVASSVEDQGNQTVLLILVAMAALFIVALGASTWLTRRLLLDSIGDLARGTRRVAAGDYSSAIPVRSNDELGELAESFNAMASEVMQRNAELEARVRERTHDLEALYLQTGQRVRELEAIGEVASSFTLESPLSTLLDGVARQVVSATAATGCAIAAWEPGSEEVPVAVGRAWVPAGFMEAALGAWPAAGPSGVRAQEVYPGARARLTEADPSLRFDDDDGWDRVWMVPVVYRERSVGLIAACFERDHEPSEAERSFVEAVADQLAVAIENARLLERAMATGALEERQRLARELHDSVSQALYGIGLGARTARRRLGADGPPGVIEPVEYVLQLAEAGLTEMRALIFELRPESLEEEGIVAALRRQVAALEARWGIEIESSLDVEPDLPIAAKEALYRIAQESMQNIVKHAQASHITIALGIGASEVTLTVSDNGRGFDPNGEFPGHLGLRSMRERAEQFGATFRVQSVLGLGTKIEVVAPLAPGG